MEDDASGGGDDYTTWGGSASIIPMGQTGTDYSDSVNSGDGHPSVAPLGNYSGGGAGSQGDATAAVGGAIIGAAIGFGLAGPLGAAFGIEEGAAGGAAVDVLSAIIGHFAAPYFAGPSGGSPPSLTVIQGGAGGGSPAPPAGGGEGGAGGGGPPLPKSITDLLNVGDSGTTSGGGIGGGGGGNVPPPDDVPDKYPDPLGYNTPNGIGRLITDTLEPFDPDASQEERNEWILRTDYIMSQMSANYRLSPGGTANIYPNIAYPVVSRIDPTRIFAQITNFKTTGYRVLNLDTLQWEDPILQWPPSP